jgi:2-oxoisovalerate dehydrogenase E1 component alpha subunit
MMNSGEEATQFGSSAAMDPEDMLYLQYREVGVLIWRGYTVDNCMNQCFSNSLDLGRGRQMPVHYGSPDFNVQFISSCLATQMPHGKVYVLVPLSR